MMMMTIINMIMSKEWDYVYELPPTAALLLISQVTLRVNNHGGMTLTEAIPDWSTRDL
jgi:hypothetical protein